MRDEDIAQPGAKIVYGGDYAFSTRVGMVLNGNPARMDQDRRENADVVPLPLCQLGRARWAMVRALTPKLMRRCQNKDTTSGAVYQLWSHETWPF